MAGGEESLAMMLAVTMMTLLPSELVIDILSRLPGEALARCKCVCKAWRSLIARPEFRDAYRQRNKGLILMYTTVPADASEIRRLQFFHCPLRQLGEPHEEFTSLRKLNVWYGLHSPVTQTVDGLVCVGGIESSSLKFGVGLHNICTGEWKLLRKLLDVGSSISTFHLGFDPVSRDYKLLRLLFSVPYELLNGAHILTLRPRRSQSRWRKLDYHAIHGIQYHTLMEVRTSSDDGLSCWKYSFPIAGEAERLSGRALVCFDYNSERFQSFRIQTASVGVPRLCGVTRSNGHVALWSNPRNELSCFIKEDDEGSWKEHRVRYSADFVETGCFVLASGKLLASASPDGHNVLVMKNDPVGKKEPRRVYSYSHLSSNDEEVFHVGSFPDGTLKLRYDSPYHNCAWLKLDKGHLYCLFESNNLHLSLNEILGG